MWFVNLYNEKLYTFLKERCFGLEWIAQNDLWVPIGNCIDSIKTYAANNQLTDDQKKILESLKSVLIRNKREVTDQDMALKMCNDFLKTQYAYHINVVFNGFNELSTVFSDDRIILGDKHNHVTALTVDFTLVSSPLLKVPMIDAIYSYNGADNFEWHIVPF